MGRLSYLVGITCIHIDLVASVYGFGALFPLEIWLNCVCCPEGQNSAGAGDDLMESYRLKSEPALKHNFSNSLWECLHSSPIKSLWAPDFNKYLFFFFLYSPMNCGQKELVDSVAIRQYTHSEKYIWREKGFLDLSKFYFCLIVVEQDFARHNTLSLVSGFSVWNKKMFVLIVLVQLQINCLHVKLFFFHWVWSTCPWRFKCHWQRGDILGKHYLCYWVSGQGRWRL